jgi:penicillin-binding protein-related factor A (putative recombinase)
VFWIIHVIPERIKCVISDGVFNGNRCIGGRKSLGKKAVCFMPDLSQRPQRKKNPMNQIRGRVNNAQGYIFENEIKKACQIYSQQGRAEIDKTPEPFRVLKKRPDGKFTGCFTALAQPDFQGTLASGKSIVFETKYTTADRIERGVLTQNQMETLEAHHTMGAAAFVVFGIGSSFFTMPWVYWRDMKQYYGRQYVMPEDLAKWQVKYMGAVMFLDFLHEIKSDIGKGDTDDQNHD